MKRTIQVYLGDDARRVGTIHFDAVGSRQHSVFAYEDSWLKGKDEQGVFCRAFEAGRRTAPPLVELGRLLAATRAVETENETAADLAYLRGRGTSLAGMRPKCTVIDDDGRLSIGKFPSVTDERPVTKGEILAMTLAKAAGIHVAESRLVESDGLPVALIRRFDRTVVKPKNRPPGLPWQQAFTPLWPARPAVTPYLSCSRLPALRSPRRGELRFAPVHERTMKSASHSLIGLFHGHRRFGDRRSLRRLFHSHE